MLDGYRLEVEPDRVDALRLRRLLAAVSRSRGEAGERETLEHALTLWRGMPLEGVECGPLRNSTFAQLVELRLAAVERWVDLGLAEGLHSELVAEVRTLAACHPLREPLWERLLVTLHRCGRLAEALAAYEQPRSRLAGELGIAPSPGLRGTHAVLLAEESLQEHLTVPYQLPRRANGFVGRVDALEELNGLLTGQARICVITGTAGGRQEHAGGGLGAPQRGPLPGRSAAAAAGSGRRRPRGRHARLPASRAVGAVAPGARGRRRADDLRCRTRPARHTGRVLRRAGCGRRAAAAGARGPPRPDIARAAVAGVTASPHPSEAARLLEPASAGRAPRLRYLRGPVRLRAAAQRLGRSMRGPIT
ncbi:BTAD domain-containing putative transcriptional regulator [Nonomuraea angiospora]|uniref:AfsR/SARP family transcriptional regulator n=1 Tax=Nonomuraea angiospora TaxID=46172 RepID=UPI00379DC270